MRLSKTGRWGIFSGKAAGWFLFAGVLLIVLLMWYAFSLPKPLFRVSYATILEDARGNLLGAKIAADGQWRFPPPDSLPWRYKKAIIAFEDKRFYSHPGFDVRALVRALIQNIKAGEIRSGGSTITMQVIRLSRPGKPRNIFQKLLEIILATRLELKFSKEEILKMYAAHAPFGGNVVGIEAAAWRYFGCRLQDLSWGESALLAILPNTPATVFPGRREKLLRDKRDRLLEKLYRNGEMDSLSLVLAKSEEIPGKPYHLPRLVPHLVERYAAGRQGGRIHTTIDGELQQRILHLLPTHQKILAGNEIFNTAVLVVETETGKVLTYIGNAVPEGENGHGDEVDVIRAPRSTGSILKPFLYAAMLHSGEILPDMLVPDYPVRMQGFAPRNFDRTFQGAVKARRAIARSLNVPAVHMLQQYGVQRFHKLLRDLGMTTLTFDPDHYGLTLILGGAEGTLWDLCGIYAGLGRELLHYSSLNGKYDPDDVHEPVLLLTNRAKDKDTVITESYAVLSAAAVYFMLEAMAEVNRPDAEGMWQWFEGTGKIAWKTGTSFGNRDGWAIGVTPGYVVGVWVGNASGEGRPLLTGLSCAAPIMFDVFRLLPKGRWFVPPWDDMAQVTVCHESGYRPGPNCPHIDTVWAPAAGLTAKACPFHRIVHLSSDRKYRVSDLCIGQEKMVHLPWFVLPPAMEWFYRSHHPDYAVLPDWKEGCAIPGETPSLDILYPRSGSKVYIPRELSGTESRMICEAIHRRRNARLFWHLDDIFLGVTTGIHQKAINPSEGKHILTLTDEEGEALQVFFEVIAGR
ncbi:MAG: penicillin-binding protein 1C [Bacteroidales bacterium]